MFVSVSRVALSTLVALVVSGMPAFAATTITVVGSPVLQPLVTEAAKAYEREHADTHVAIGAASSRDAIARLLARGVDVVDSDVAPPSGADVIERKIAALPYAFVATDAAGVKGLTRKQIRDIYAGRITNWKDVGGNDLAIVAIGSAPGSAAHAAFDATIGGASAAAADARGKDDAANAAAMANGAIAYVSFADAASHPKLVSLALDGTAPSVENVTNGSYGFLTYERMIVRSSASDDVNAFVGYVARNAPTLQLGGLVAVASMRGQDTGLLTIGATTANGQYRDLNPTTATALAPSQASLRATEPGSLLTREFIELASSPIAEYSRVVNIAPSVSGVASNGPGLSETKVTLRGFGDDQTNVTFDGIPWGDTNNPSHHSTSFFPAPVLGGASVERGPGNASDMGYATFGGSINLFSKQASATPQFSAFDDIGTWNTNLIGTQFQSGRIDALHGTTFQGTFQSLYSGGYLTYSTVKSQNYSVKIENKLSSATTITAFSTINRIYYQQPDGASGTLSQFANFGQNFQLDNDPTSMNYVGYNHTSKATDLSYLRLRSELPFGVFFDNKFYSYAYNNQTISSNDATWMGTTPSTNADPRVTVNPVTGAKILGNIPGIDKQNKYRVFGDIAKFTKTFGENFVSAGAWWELADTDRHQYDLDLTTGGYNRIETPTNGAFLSGTNRPLDAVKFDQQSKIRNWQPFVEANFVLPTGTTIRPGVKYVNIDRSDNAAIENSSRTPNHAADITYTATLPYVAVNQRLNSGLSAYVQYAKGFQIPDLNTFYILNPTQNATQPQQTINKQLGFVGANPDTTWDIDLYRIDFTNKLVSNGLAGSQQAFLNIGGARYQGVEAQVTQSLRGGYALYANGTLNSAKALDTNSQISGAPDSTWAAGVLYKSARTNASLLYKQTGWTPQQNFDPTKAPINGTPYYQYYSTQPYGNLDFALKFLFPHYHVQFNVYNLGDSTKITSVKPGKPIAYDTYTYQTPRSLNITLGFDP